jgi:hypothetical protein
MLQFDEITRVEADGTRTVRQDLTGPSLVNRHIEDQAWDLLILIMDEDDTEAIEAAEAEYLATPGTYVALLPLWEPEDEDDAGTAEGWALARLRTPMGYVARCTKCGEGFVPDGEDDLVHIGREDGTECGGQGEMTGAWYAPRD